MNNNNTYKNLKKINKDLWDKYHGYSEETESFFTDDSNKDYLLEISNRLRQDLLYVEGQINVLFSDLAVRLGVKLTFEEWMEANFTEAERAACCYSDKLDEYRGNNQGIYLPENYDIIRNLKFAIEEMYENYFYFRKTLSLLMDYEELERNK